MLASAATGRQQELYAGAVRQTLQSLNMVDDATLVGLTRLGIPEVQALKREVAEILPAGNLPAFLLQGLVQLKDRTIKPERVAADLHLIFQATKQVGIFGTFLAAPALALHGYQKLLALAGKDIESAFPDGPWQFYTEFGLREDAARHCAETVGFQRVTASEEDALTAWVAAALHTIFAYDDLLANEWDERMLLRTLDVLVEEHAAARFPSSVAPDTSEHAQQMAAAVARVRAEYGLERLASGWVAVRPYRTPDGGLPGNYAAARRARFRAYIDQELQQLPLELRTALDARLADHRKAELVAYQRQMTLLMTLDAESYRDQRVALSLHQARVAVVVCGQYYLIDACARDANGNLLMYPLDGGATSSGVALSLRTAGDGTLRDSHDRPVTIDRRGRVKIGTLAVGSLHHASLETIKRQVRAILQHVDVNRITPNHELAATDRLLAQAPRERQTALRTLLTPETQAELLALRMAPIIINWDVHDGGLPLTSIRRTHRGIGDHALTIIRTDRSMLFDLSHIFFDGGWGMALAEIMTNLATDFAALAAQTPTDAGTTLSTTPLRLEPTPAFLQAAQVAMAHSPAEAAAETTAVDLRAIIQLRQRLGRRQLALTVNDILLLARCTHAASYHPGPLAERALGAIASLEDGADLVRQIMRHFDEQRAINPALLIPMDASGVDPRLRLYPATFRNPLPELLTRLDHCNALVVRLKQQPDPATLALFEQQRSALFADLYNFGAALQALKQVTMRGEGFTTAALRLLGHLPKSMQHLLDLIPQKFGVLNEILKGREVFSNVGQVVATSTLTRFMSARDDGETKLLVWGVMSDAKGRLVVTLRDFRPHVAPLIACGCADLAEALAQDYLDDYAAGVNALIRRIQRVLAYV